MSTSTFGKINKEHNTKAKNSTPEGYKINMKRDKTYQTKVVIRRLPPTMTEEQFVEQFSPFPDHDYLYFVKADMRLGSHAFSHAYINFLIPEDIFLFKDRFDGYVFLDSKGNEYPAIVEFSPFQKIPKKRNHKKHDAKCGTIVTDPDYLKFLESLKNPDDTSLPSAESYLEEIETREKELKANNGVLKMTTPLIEFLKARKIEQQKIREEKREERKRKELEKKRIREDERRRRKAERDKERTKEKVKEKESLSEKEATDEPEESLASESVKQPEAVVQVLKNPDKKEAPTPSSKSKDYFPSSRTGKERERGKKEWERTRLKDRPKMPARVFYNEKERGRRDKTDYKVYSSKKQPSNESTSQKHKSSEVKQTEISTKDTPEVAEKEIKEPKVVCDQLPGSSHFSSKDKRDNSCPGNIETLGNEKSETEPSLKQYKNSSKSEDMAEMDMAMANYSKRGKDPRVERRIRNKDRPSLEIYRPGMRRLGTQRNSPQIEISSASNSSSPSPTPPVTSKSEQADEEGDNASLS